MKERGYRYARAVFPSGGYEFPENPLNFRPSTSIILKDAMKLVERFKREEAQDRDPPGRPCPRPPTRAFRPR